MFPLENAFGIPGKLDLCGQAEEQELELLFPLTCGVWIFYSLGPCRNQERAVRRAWKESLVQVKEGSKYCVGQMGNPRCYFED